MGGPRGLESSPDASPPMIVSPSGPFWTNFGPPLGLPLGSLSVVFWVQILNRFRGPFRARPGTDLEPILGPILGPEGVQKWSKNGPQKGNASEEGKGTKNHSKEGFHHLKNLKNLPVLQAFLKIVLSGSKAARGYKMDQN